MNPFLAPKWTRFGDKGGGKTAPLVFTLKEQSNEKEFGGQWIFRVVKLQYRHSSENSGQCGFC